MPVIELPQPIVGGDYVSAGSSDFGFHVAIMLSGFVYCGGFILAKQFAGTAAHCLVNQTLKDLSVGYGSTHVRDMTIEKLDQIHYHEEFNPTTGEFDVGLIKITGAFNSPFDPIKINMDILAFGSKVTVSGFGRMEPGGPGSAYLRYTELTVWDPAACNEVFMSNGLSVTENMICAFDEYSTACNGDSGGPLTYKGQLVGIVSWGASNCHDSPVIFTDVTSPRIYNWWSKYLSL